MLRNPMGSQHFLLAVFQKPALAKKLAASLTTFFARHAKQFDERDSDDEPTKAEQALYNKYHVKWLENQTWGDGDLMENEPEVRVLGDRLLLSHFHIPGGFGSELPKVIQKAGGKILAEESGLPLVQASFTFPKDDRLRRDVAALFAQREEPLLDDWKPPRWAKRELEGPSQDASIAVDGDHCTFTLPLATFHLEPLRKHLEALGAKSLILSFATPKEVEKNVARENALQAAPTPPKSKAATIIPTSAPKVKRVRSAPTMFGGETEFVCIASNGEHLFAMGHDQLSRSTDGLEFRRLIENASGFHEAGYVQGNELWTCGYAGIRHSDNGGDSFQKMVHKGNPHFISIARDDDGMLWASTDDGSVFVSNEKSLERVKCQEKEPVFLARTAYGVLLLCESGRLYFGQNGKLSTSAFNARAPLKAACMTPSGTLVVVGGWTRPVAFRSEDGKQFTASKVQNDLRLTSVVALPDGRIVAGGAVDSLMVSHDDGRTFKKLEFTGKNQRDFSTATLHKGSAYFAGQSQELVRIS